MKLQVKASLKPCNDKVNIEDFYESEQQVLQNIKNSIREDLMGNKEESVNFRKQYVEWAKPYGHDPYIVTEFKLEESFNDYELYNYWLEDLEEELDQFYEDFVVDRVTSAEIIG